MRNKFFLSLRDFLGKDWRLSRSYGPQNVYFPGGSNRSVIGWNWEELSLVNWWIFRFRLFFIRFAVLNYVYEQILFILNFYFVFVYKCRRRRSFVICFLSCHAEKCDLDFYVHCDIFHLSNSGLSFPDFYTGYNVFTEQPALPALLRGANEEQAATNHRKIPVAVEQLKDYLGITMQTLLSALTNKFFF